VKDQGQAQRKLKSTDLRGNTYESRKTSPKSQINVDNHKKIERKMLKHDRETIDYIFT